MATAKTPQTNPNSRRYNPSATSSSGSSTPSSSGRTYQDTSGNYFNTQAEAAASNTNMGTNPKASSYSKANAVGKQILDPVTGEYKGTSFIGATDMGKTGKDIPTYTPPVDTTDYNSLLTPIQQEEKNIRDESKNNLQTLIENYVKPVDKTSTFLQMENEAGIAQKQQDAKIVADKINSINARAQANQLQVVGQGRGIPEVIIGGQQAQIAKEAAIEVLPLTAEYAAKKGDLEYAQNRLDKLFEIKSKDIDAKTAYENKVVETLYNFADKETQAKLDDIKLRKSYEREDLKETVKNQTEMAKMAYTNNQASLGSKISSLDYKSPTYKQDLAKLTSQLYDPAKDLELKLKRIQIENIRSEINTRKSTETANQFKERIAQEKEKKQEKAQLPILRTKINLIDDVLNNQALSTTVGPTSQARNKGLFGIGSTPEAIFNRLTGDKQKLIGSVNQLVSKEFLQSVLDLKAAGGTLGQLTEREGQKLQTAATKIGSWEIHEDGDNNKPVIGYNISEKEFINELSNIREATKNIYNELGGLQPGSMEEKQAADAYIINDVGNALETSGGNYGSYK